jgi:hypothetical protein
MTAHNLILLGCKPLTPFRFSSRHRNLISSSILLKANGEYIADS